jgi:pimeloyl-ACP methyl ester carboxylesterase
LIPLLDYDVVAVDLPGRDGNRANLSAITHEDWVRSAADQISVCSAERVVLVGHSLAGIILPNVAVRLGKRVAAQVFISALIPAEGKSAAQTLGLGVDDLDGGFHPPEQRILRRTLCNDLTEEQTEHLLSRLIPEPGQPWLQAVSRDDMPSVPRYYIRLEADRAIPPALQVEMINNLGGAEEISVDAGHSAMISKPQALALHLNRIAAASD